MSKTSEAANGERRCSVNKGVLKNFVNLTLVSEAVFNKVASRPKVADRSAIFIQKKLQHRCFSCEICEVFKSNYLREHLRTAAF